MRKGTDNLGDLLHLREAGDDPSACSMHAVGAVVVTLERTTPSEEMVPPVPMKATSRSGDSLSAFGAPPSDGSSRCPFGGEAGDAFVHGQHVAELPLEGDQRGRVFRIRKRAQPSRP